MLDDELFSMLMIAEKLGLSIREAMRTPYKEMLAWDAAFQRKGVEQRR